MRNATVLIIFLLLLTFAFNAFALFERFPKPDFQSGYKHPQTTTPEARSIYLEYLDVFVLLIALSLASYFALKQRSRRNIFVLMVFSLIYFGFWRKGCVCSIGSIQNVVYALFTSSYAIPLAVVFFFVLPLVFTLFFGRTFCAAVCPLGVIQDAVILKPTTVPAWQSQLLGIFPYIYLGLTVLFAATGAGFLICRYDPFIGFFRFGASFNMIVFGGFILLLGTVVARPYCRFLCPYGVLLNWMSRLSKWHVSITPAECINCRLCEESCPFDAINKPTPESYPEYRTSELRRLLYILILFPAVIAGGGWTLSRLYAPLARQHFTVALAEEILLEDSGQRTETTEETRTFRTTGIPKSELFEEAKKIQENFKLGGWLLGGFLGIVFSVKIFNFSVRRKRTEYTADTGTCLSCGRCFSYCPIELTRLEKIKGAAVLNESS